MKTLAQYFIPPRDHIRYNIFMNVLTAWCAACDLETSGWCGACEPCLMYAGPKEHTCTEGPSSPWPPTNTWTSTRHPGTH